MATPGHGPAHMVVSIPTFIGGVLSMLSCGFVLCCYWILPHQKHFRHVLIINLTVADFVNAINNSVSGAYILASPSHRITPGPACYFNAWMGQLTVQAVDFSILAISLCLLWTVRQVNIVPVRSLQQNFLMSACIWIVPLITSTSGLLLKAYGPVSGNWCWIEPHRVLDQYLLAHGIRITIILVTLGLYAYIAWKLKKMFKPFADETTYGQSTELTTAVSHDQHSLFARTPDDRLDQTNVVMKTIETSVHTQARNHSVDFNAFPPAPGDSADRARNSSEPRSALVKQPNVNRMLLLHGYPILYVLLWLPGLSNRLVSVFRTPPVWLTALQASTQFIGLANAITYGYNENIRRQLQQFWCERKSYFPTND